MRRKYLLLGFILILTGLILYISSILAAITDKELMLKNVPFEDRPYHIFNLAGFVGIVVISNYSSNDISSLKNKK